MTILGMQTVPGQKIPASRCRCRAVRRVKQFCSADKSREKHW